MSNARLKLVACNSVDQIDNYLVEQELRRDMVVYPIHCGSCGHRYQARCGDVLDNPECPRCGM